jgi:hypothetical protein
VPVTDLRTTIRRVLGYHQPDAEDDARNVKVCTCGHETPIGDMQARQEHLIDVLTTGLAPLLSVLPGRCSYTYDPLGTSRIADRFLCDLRAGHAGQHESTRYDGSTARWGQFAEPEGDEDMTESESVNQQSAAMLRRSLEQINTVDYDPVRHGTLCDWTVETLDYLHRESGRHAAQVTEIHRMVRAAGHGCARGELQQEIAEILEGS